MKKEKNPLEPERIKAAQEIRKLGIQWWWQWLTSDNAQLKDEWENKTDQMSEREFRNDWQNSAFHYELEFRRSSQRDSFKVSWIELTLQERHGWRNKCESSHGINSFCSEPAVQYLHFGRNTKPRSGFSQFLRLNLNLNPETFLNLYKEMQREAGITPPDPRNPGAPKNPWRDIELFDYAKHFPDGTLTKLKDPSRLSKVKRLYGLIPR